MMRKTRSLTWVPVAALVVLSACSGASDDTVASSVGDSGPTTTADDTTPPTSGGGATTTARENDPAPTPVDLPDPCSLVVIDEWSAITGLDLEVPPDQDTAAAAGGTICVITAAGTILPLLYSVQVNAVGEPGTVANIAVFLDNAEGMVVVEGIGDRAIYYDANTTFDGEQMAFEPVLGFESGGINVNIVGSEGDDIAVLTELARSVIAEL